jgi:hypothetical protein
VKQTVRGVTFEPSTLFLVSVGYDHEPFRIESYPPVSSYAEAEGWAHHTLNRAPLVNWVEIRSAVSDGLSVKVGTVWPKDEARS